MAERQTAQLFMQNPQYDLAFIFPTIGRAPWHYVEEALNSIANNREGFTSQVVVADNSQDSEFSRQLSDHCRSVLPDAIIHRIPERIGMSENWNFGFRHTAATWALYVHDDDYLLRLDAEVLGGAENVALIRGETTYRFEGKASDKKAATEPGVSGVINDCPKFCSTLIRSSALAKLGGWKPELGYFSDWEGFLQLHLSEGSCVDPRLKGVYRVHGDNASLHDRETNYGNFAPQFLASIFEVTDDPAIRRHVLAKLRWFLAPPRGLFGRWARRIEMRRKGQL